MREMSPFSRGPINFGRSGVAPAERSSRSRLAWLLPLSTLLGALELTLHATTARACDCSVDQQVFPRAEDGVLPQDTRVWIPRALAEQRARDSHQPVTFEGVSPSIESVATLFSITDTSGKAIAFSVAVIVDRDDRDLYFMLTPTELLAPGDYQVAASAEDIATTFSIGSVPASTLPSPPTLQSRSSSSESGTGSSCGETRAEFFQFAAGAPLLLAAANMEPETEGEVWHASLLTAGGFVSLGQSACGNLEWNFDDGPVDMRFAALNFAGQTSTWSEPQRAYVEATGCACAAVGRRDGSLGYVAWVYVWVGLLFGRRRLPR